MRIHVIDLQAVESHTHIQSMWEPRALRKLSRNGLAREHRLQQRSMNLIMEFNRSTAAGKPMGITWSRTMLSAELATIT